VKYHSHKPCPLDVEWRKARVYDAFIKGNHKWDDNVMDDDTGNCLYDTTDF
jgi:hypothetical protein